MSSAEKKTKEPVVKHYGHQCGRAGYRAGWGSTGLLFFPLPDTTFRFLGFQDDDGYVFFFFHFYVFFFVLRIPDGILSVIYSVKISRATRAKCYWTLLYYYKTVLLTTITLVMLTRTTHMIFITCSSNIFFLFSTTY